MIEWVSEFTKGEGDCSWTYELAMYPKEEEIHSRKARERGSHHTPPEPRREPCEPSRTKHTKHKPLLRDCGDEIQEERGGLLCWPEQAPWRMN